MMRSQRGSVLAGTLVLSAVITAGAAGILVLAGNLESSFANLDAHRLLLRSAESGIQLGSRWMRMNIDEGGLAAFVAATDLTLEPIALEGASVRVRLEPLPAGGGHDLVALAETVPCTERVTVRRRIGTVTGGAAGLSTITFTTWTETSEPCVPADG